jgi:hypothetical protein
VAGDWDGDGLDTVGLYNPSDRRWYLNNKTDGSITDLVVLRTLGLPANARPITGNWDGKGAENVLRAEGEAVIDTINPDQFLPAYTFERASSPRRGDGHDLRSHPSSIHFANTFEARNVYPTHTDREIAFAGLTDVDDSPDSIDEELIGDLFLTTLLNN